MDIRDFKEEPPVVEGGKYLEKIYELQKGLLDHYISIEGLPQYPIDVNTKASQVLLKDFTGRVIEELAEGFESHVLVYETVQKYGGNVDAMTEEEYQQMISHLQNLNEEQSDAMHFMVELLIYANIQPEDILSWVSNKWREGGRKDIILGNDVINEAMVLSNIQSDDDHGIRPFGGTMLLSDSLTEEQCKYLPGGYRISHDILKYSKMMLWDITYALNISRNCLKNKPWKQSGVMTNETLYQSKLVEAFVYMIGYYSFLGISTEEIYYLYFKKNLANKFRISSKY